jgi:transcriptional regulator with XRE-family HTH domain
VEKSTNARKILGNSTMTAAKQLDLLLNGANLCMTELARKLGVPVQQLKDIRRGKTQKFSSEVTMALVDKFQVDPAWLIHGSGTMHKPVFTPLDAALELALRYAPLSEALIKEMQQVAAKESLLADDLARRFKARLPQSVLAQRELRLLENYRSAISQDKLAIERMSALAAEAVKPKVTNVVALPVREEHNDDVRSLVAAYLNASKESKDLILMTATSFGVEADDEKNTMRNQV